jgi:hypothetical protein
MGDKKLFQINVSLKEGEYERFTQAYKNTSYRSKAAYARKLLLGKPATVLYRNRSLDEFIESGVQLRKQLKLLTAKETLTREERTDLQQKLMSIEELLITIVSICKQK